MCSKKPFETHAQAKATLRKWRSAGSSFDTAHVYKCTDCPKFHIGRKHDVMKHGDTSTRRDPQTRHDVLVADMMEDLEDVFSSQVIRISGRLSRSAQRIRQANRRALDSGPLIQPETTFVSVGGDDVDIVRK